MPRYVKYGLLPAAALVGALIGLPLLLVVWILFGGQPRVGTFKDKAVAQLPGLSVALERKFAHPFLAEYYRSLTIEQAGVGTTALDFGMDTGGLTRVRICRSQTGSILIHDFYETYEARQGETRPSLVPEPSLKKDCTEFLGVFDVDAQLGLNFIPG